MDRLLARAAIAGAAFLSGWALGVRRGQRDRKIAKPGFPGEKKERKKLEGAAREDLERVEGSVGVAIGLPPAHAGSRGGLGRSRESSPSVSDGEGEMGEGRVGGGHRMVLVVRMDLRLAKGKVGSLLCHAALGQFKKMHRAKNPHLWDWERDGRSTVVLRVPNEGGLAALKDAARASGIPTHTVVDRSADHSGPVKAVMALGPYGADAISQVTGHLNLY
ncbi:unnamed protein product [Ostreobium quekettii]|uniref:peptidyl-tRNA hydrolase n=1 Tax=Ostreobium quekettii TaxID=121088 RepID=A0A8S1J758_9CHLO|nr:unnamed protein product [Ostreobium quekettii]|eukprot:evm.model.scf_1282.5 EVM.evm.TU.scf_1282.5   scf_1282:30705-32660(+)